MILVPLRPYQPKSLAQSRKWTDIIPIAFCTGLIFAVHFAVLCPSLNVRLPYPLNPFQQDVGLPSDVYLIMCVLLFQREFSEVDWAELVWLKSRRSRPVPDQIAPFLSVPLILSSLYISHISLECQEHSAKLTTWVLERTTYRMTRHISRVEEGSF
jgi:hypothetical protein